MDHFHKPSMLSNILPKLLLNHTNLPGKIITPLFYQVDLYPYPCGSEWLKFIKLNNILCFVKNKMTSKFIIYRSNLFLIDFSYIYFFCELFS